MNPRSESNLFQQQQKKCSDVIYTENSIRNQKLSYLLGMCLRETSTSSNRENRGFSEFKCTSVRRRIRRIATQACALANALT